jgi:hypothetical protein
VEPSERETATKTEPKRRLGLIIRLLIYVPLLGIFGWQAGQTFIAQRRNADDNFRNYVRAGVQAMPAPRTIKLPNGEEMPVYEMTEQEAIDRGLLPAKTDEPAADE